MKSYKYSLNGHGIRIDRYVGSDQSICIPSHINNLAVTEIGEDAFIRCESITSVNIPRGVISIAKNAFYQCFSLKDVYLPDTLINIGDSAFFDCINLKSITIPESVTTIEQFAFWDCLSLTCIAIPQNIKNFAASSLLGCEGLKEIIVAGENPDFISVDGILFNKNRTRIIRYPSARSGEFVIPEGVRYIEDGAFDSCEKLTKITLPESLIMIFHGAFRNCKSLTSLLVVGDSIKQISLAGYNMTNEFGIFENCELFNELSILPSSNNYINYDHNELSYEMKFFDLLGSLKNLEKVIVHEDHKLYKSMGGILFNKDQTELMFCPHKKSGVITIPEGIKVIWDLAFCECPNVTKISISEGVTRIADFAFENCLALEEVEIPSSVTTIDFSAFNGCFNLSKISVDSLNTEYTSSNGVLFNRNCTRLLLVPYALSGPFTVHCDVTEIGEFAFDGCKLLTQINIPDSVIEIGDRAFGDCTSLACIRIPQGVTKIGKDAFENCSKLESILVDATNIFYVSLDGILFNKEKTEIIRCPSQKIGTVTLPESVILIHKGAFRGCQKLSRVLIPSSVTTIGKGAFADCTKLDHENLSEILNRGGEESFTVAAN